MKDRDLKDIICDVANLAEEYYDLAEETNAWEGFFTKEAQWWLDNAMGCVFVNKKRQMVVFLAGSLAASVAIEKNSRSHHITFDSSDPESLFFIHDAFKSKLLEIL